MINDWLSSSMKEVSMISSADNDINEFILSTGDFNFLWFPFLSNFKIFVNLHDVGVCLKLVGAMLTCLIAGSFRVFLCANICVAKSMSFVFVKVIEVIVNKSLEWRFDVWFFSPCNVLYVFPHSHLYAFWTNLKNRTKILYVSKDNITNWRASL